MKKSIVGLLMIMLLVPAFSFASTTTPTTVTSEQTQVDQRQELMLQLISLLRTYITQLQQQLALKGVTGAPVVLGVSTSTASSTEQAETPKKRRGGGGGGGGSSSSRAAAEAKETACRLAADLRIVPGETKLAYYTQQTNQPVYAGWAPDTTKELYNYLVAYTNNYIATGNEFFTHVPDYRLYYALQHVRVLETRFSQYVQNKTACGEEAIDATDVLVPLTPEILALTVEDPATATSTDAYDATLTFGLSDNNPDSTTLTVEADAYSDYYTLLSFNIEAEGGEVVVDKAVVRVDVPDEDIEDVVSDVLLLIEGQYYEAESFGLLANGLSEIGADGSYVWYVFDLNNEIEFNDDEEVEVNVEVGFAPQEGAYPRFQAVSVQVDEETRGLWESEGYDDLSPALDYFGLALGETHLITPPGLIITDYDFDVNTLGENDTIGEFNFELEVTAVEDDFYVSSLISESGSIGVVYGIEGPDGFTATASAVVTSTADEDVNDVFSIDEGNTENINITITLDPSITGNYRVTLEDVFYAGNNQGTPSVGSLSEQEVLRSSFISINNVVDDIEIIQDSTAPTFRSPYVSPNPAIEGQSVQFGAAADDNYLLEKTELYINSVLVHTCDFAGRGFASADCSSTTRTLPIGVHQFYAIVYDQAGNSTTSLTRTINVNPLVIDSTAPTFRSPYVSPNPAIEGQSVQFGAAADDNYLLEKTELYINSVLVHTCDFAGRGFASADCSSTTRTLPIGVHQFYAIVYDQAGNSTTSLTRTINVNPL